MATLVEDYQVHVAALSGLPGVSDVRAALTYLLSNTGSTAYAAAKTTADGKCTVVYLGRASDSTAVLAAISQDGNKKWTIGAMPAGVYLLSIFAVMNGAGGSPLRVALDFPAQVGTTYADAPFPRVLCGRVPAGPITMSSDRDYNAKGTAELGLLMDTPNNQSLSIASGVWSFFAGGAGLISAAAAQYFVKVNY